MIKILNFIITKLEKHTKDKIKKETYRNILSAIDEYLNRVKGIVNLRYYNAFTFDVDDVEEALEEADDNYIFKKLDEAYEEFFWGGKK